MFRFHDSVLAGTPIVGILGSAKRGGDPGSENSSCARSMVEKNNDHPRPLTDAHEYAGVFDVVVRTRLVFGAGSIARLPGLLGEEGTRRVLVVTDAGIVAAGHLERVLRYLRSAGFECEIFPRVRENPDTACVDDCLEVARRFRPEVLVGLGGGSSMDTAKGCNFLYSNGGRMRDYWGVGKATKPMLPFVAVPTTAGTGSECQSAALIADASTHQKMACLDPKAAARVALLDPELTVSQPPRVTACTGIDAIAHAVETAVTRKRNPISSMYSREAFRLLVPSLPRVLESPRDIQARGRMLLGAAFAGLAIENSMLGAAHSAANPLTARFGVVHGVAVGLMLPSVVRYNAEENAIRELYLELAASIGIWRPGDPAEDGIRGLIGEMERLLDVASMPPSLLDAGVEEKHIVQMAGEAAGQWTAGFNPRPIVAGDFVRLYREAMQPRTFAAG